MVMPTPGTNNIFNTVPVLAPIPDQFVYPGQTLTVYANAVDNDPGQPLGEQFFQWFLQEIRKFGNQIGQLAPGEETELFAAGAGETQGFFAIRQGSPGLYGYSAADIFYDNVKVMVGER